MQVLYLGRALRTKETLPDFLKWRRVTLHPLVFHGLTGSQRTPGFRASHLIPKVGNITPIWRVIGPWDKVRKCPDFGRMFNLAPDFFFGPKILSMFNVVV